MVINDPAHLPDLLFVLKNLRACFYNLQRMVEHKKKEISIQLADIKITAEVYSESLQVETLKITSVTDPRSKGLSLTMSPDQLIAPL
jgi:hypothetical protein